MCQWHGISKGPESLAKDLIETTLVNNVISEFLIFWEPTLRIAKIKPGKKNLFGYKLIFLREF